MQNYAQIFAFCPSSGSRDAKEAVPTRRYMVTVVLYGPVRQAVGRKEVTAAGTTVGAVVEALAADYPVLADRLLDGDEVRGQVQVFVDGRKIGPLQGLETPLDGGETVQITEAMSGG